jgi:hypothetical protein
MADEAVIRTLEAFLNGTDPPTAFIKRADEIARMRGRLKEGEPAHVALVFD